MTRVPLLIAPLPDARGNARELLDRTHALCLHTETPGTVQRTFLRLPALALLSDLHAWAASAGARSRTDNSGNFRAVRPAAHPDAPTLIIGSHLDTVPDAGRYDGLLGVTLGLQLMSALHAQGAALPYHLEVVGFSEEEGVRFGVPFIGSRALIGTARPLLDLTDADGVSVERAIRAAGLDPEQLDQARSPGPHLGYLEVHIEQGPVLEARGIPLGVVSAIAGQSRVHFTFTGSANHAGTTPMHLRRDALTGASEFVLACEGYARSVPGLVATVGRIQPRPGATNVIPGQVDLTLDLRHASDDTRRTALSQLTRQATELAGARGLDVQFTLASETQAVPMDARLQDVLRAAARAEHLPTLDLVSGAGHDAMVIAPHLPGAMLFLRSPGGVSHHPEESVLDADVEAALRVCWRALHDLAQFQEQP